MGYPSEDYERGLNAGIQLSADAVARYKDELMAKLGVDTTLSRTLSLLAADWLAGAVAAALWADKDRVPELPDPGPGPTSPVGP